MSNERKIFSLTQLNASLERLFWDQFSNRTFWITAEIIKINQKSGHFYLELADSTNKEVTARNTAVIWAFTYKNLASAIGNAELNSILQAGNKVLFNVKIEYHKIFGLKLKIQEIDPTYSYGEIERKRQEVLLRLKQENLFDNQKKLRLPVIIKRIALIGSPGTSGFRDFEDELFNNHAFRNFVVRTFPVRVQGEAAINEITKAIQEANQYDAEVIVILRGGGNKIDLALFDNYEINKQICLSRLPVLTGIGHETDEVVADLVARQNFITPTAVARYIHYAIHSFLEIMQELHAKSMQKAQQLLVESKTDFLHYNNYLSHYSRELVHFWRATFQDIEFEIAQKCSTLLFLEKEKTNVVQHKVFSGLLQHIQSENSEINFLFEKISRAIFNQIEYEKEFQIHQKLRTIQILSQQLIDNARMVTQNQEELLKLLNPLKILASGYTISMINDKDLIATEVKIGDFMKTLSSNSLITSKIIQYEKFHPEN